MFTRRGEPVRRGGKNSLQEEQATACEDAKTNRGSDAVLRSKRQLVKTPKQIAVAMRF
jgi:hypothetical protein